MNANQNAIIKDAGFHHIAFNVKDFDAAVAFYTEALGFQKSLSWGNEGERAIMLNIGDGGCIELFERPSEVTDLPGTLLHFAIKTSDCEAAYNRAISAGATVKMEPKELTIKANEGDKPVKIAFCYGLDHEVIEFFEETKDK